MSGKRRTVFTQNNLPETVRYHGVFLDDSRGIPVVDIDRSAVVVLFGRTDGYIWTDRQGTNVFLWRVSIEYTSPWAHPCAGNKKTKRKNSRHKPVYFPLATAWETNCYGKTLNRQLSAVSVHKKSRDLCESGNKTVKRWRERRNNIPLSDIHRNSMFKVSFYKPEARPCHVVPWQTRQKNDTFVLEYQTIMNSLCKVRFTVSGGWKPNREFSLLQEFFFFQTKQKKKKKGAAQL